MTTPSLAPTRKRSLAQLQASRERAKVRRIEQATMQAAVLNDPNALLLLATVRSLVGLGATAIYDRIRAGTFPAPIRLSVRCSRWKCSSIKTWLAAQGLQ